MISFSTWEAHDTYMLEKIFLTANGISENERMKFCLGIGINFSWLGLGVYGSDLVWTRGRGQVY